MDDGTESGGADGMVGADAADASGVRDDEELVKCSCDDGLECTADECDGTGGCLFEVKPGRCLIDGECFKEGDIDPANPCRECISVVSRSEWSADDTNLCSDDDNCTAGDHCADGECAGDSEPVECNDGNPCTSDGCTLDAKCAHEPVSGPCDDGDACTLGDECAEGSCKPGPLVECDDDNPCTTDMCDPAMGCHFEPGSAPCQDLDPCTEGDHCDQGECVPGPLPLGCSDSNVCTNDWCEPGVGCWNEPAQGPCDDGDACTLGDECAGGICVAGTGKKDCGDSNPCTDDWCVPSAGCKHQFNSAACDDGNGCTVQDACDQGMCKGKARNCDDNNVCTQDLCNPKLPYGCEHSAAMLPCDDGDPCTLGDVCAGGKCAAGASKLACKDFNQCTKDSCQAGYGCKFTNIVALCDDGNPCTSGDYCQAGLCLAGSNTCTCKKDSDCSIYDDGNLCNGVLFCDKTNPNPGKWLCVEKPGSKVSCDTSQDDECLVTKCAPQTGVCVQTPSNQGAPCDDGNQCTSGDICNAGSCVGAAQIVCNDTNPCTSDSCVMLYGCMYHPVADGTSCGASGWICTNGTCSQCVPSCSGKQCGPDGCGGQCGTCPQNQLCDSGTCVYVGQMDCKGTAEPSYPSCGTVNFTGCCKNDKVYYCDAGKLYCLDCAAGGWFCGWDYSAGFYDCEQTWDADPSGLNPKQCTECLPPCPPGFSCVNGACLGCQPQCAGKQCGPDGCGGQCGACPPQHECKEGMCLPISQEIPCLGPDTPSYSFCGGIGLAGCCDADGRALWCEDGALYCVDCAADPQCGWNLDGNFYFCGTTGSADPSSKYPKTCTACLPACQQGYSCVAGKCVKCSPSCAGKQCGSDGCGGNCGTCKAGYTCKNGMCAPISACGDVTAEGKCNGTIVVWCQNNQLMQYDCKTEGHVCAFLPEYGKYGCKPDCGNVPAEGECDGTVLKECTLSGIVQVECKDFGMSCGFDDDQKKYACVSGCGDITYLGKCDGDTLMYCSSPFGGGGTLVTVDCTQWGMTCGLESEETGYDCLDACGGVTAYGHCEGDVLVHCDTTQDPPVVVYEDCSVVGDTCSLVDPVSGYGCYDEGGGALTLTGTVTFDKRTVTKTGYGPTVSKPARRIKVTLWSDKSTSGSGDDVALDSDLTDDNGAFSLSYDDPGHKVYVTAYAWWGEGSSTMHVDVESGYNWATVSASTEHFQAGPGLTKDLHVTVAKSSGAFNILDQMIRGREFAKKHFGEAPPSVWVQWDGPTGGGYWCSGGAYYDPWEVYIYIGNCAGDPNEFDDSIVLHEYGHHVSFTLSIDDNPGGMHWFTGLVDPNMAWSEGFATFFGQAVLGDPVYIDCMDDEAYYLDVEQAGLTCKAKPYLGMTQDICEALVVGSLWDIFDAAADAGDTLEMGPEEIVDVMDHYFTADDFEDRAETGVDFVDFLDGWFCRGHQQYSGLNKLVVEGYQFPYDFSGPCSDKPISPVQVRLSARTLDETEGHRVDWAPGNAGSSSLFLLTARVYAFVDASGVVLKLHFPEGVVALEPDQTLTLDVRAGEIRAFDFLVSADAASPPPIARATVTWAPHPSVHYASPSTIPLLP